LTFFFDMIERFSAKTNSQSHEFLNFIRDNEIKISNIKIKNMKKIYGNLKFHSKNSLVPVSDIKVKNMEKIYGNLKFQFISDWSL